MDKLFTLLELQRQAQEAPSRDSLLHIIVNDTKKILSYTQAVFFGMQGLGLSLEKISGNLVADPQGDYARGVTSRIWNLATMGAPLVTILPVEGQDTKRALLTLRTTEEGVLGALVLERDTPFAEAETRILEELAVTYATVLALWKRRSRHGFVPQDKKVLFRRLVYAGLFLLLFLPVRQSITAPAEIVARDAEIITAPFDGMIEDVAIAPGDAVKAGAVVARMESRSLQGQMDMALQEMTSVQAALSRLQRESLSAPEKKMDMIGLQEQVGMKKIAYDYARILQERSEIRAEMDGIAVFSGAHGLRGKPVRTGEKIMTVADPSHYELLIRVPVDAMVPVARDAPVTFYLNLSPFGGHVAKILSTGYQASPDADGLLTYKITAALPDGGPDMRIGWKGTARIKGGWTILSYTILRRPVMALRNGLGLF